MGNIKYFGVVAILALCSACSGGSGSTGVVSPPSPSPTPAMNRDLVNLVADETFYAANATVVGDISGFTPSLISDPQVRSSTFDRPDASSVVTYDASSDSFRISASGGRAAFDQTFRPQDINRAESNSDITVYERGDTVFALAEPGGPTLGLEYVAFGAWADAAASGGDTIIGFSVFGIETPFADVPTTGSATYSGELAGSIVQAGSGSGSTATLYNLAGTADLSANFAAGTVDTTLVIERELFGSGSFTPWDTITATGSISSVANSRSGMDTASFGGAAAAVGRSNVTGTLSGRFFGPSANEVGGSFSLSDPGTIDVVGVFVAGRP